MLDRTSAESLRSADLKDNLQDIQDNVVAPILLRYGRHIFVKFNDGAKARAWLRRIFKRVNARPKEHGTRFTVNIGFTYEGLKALGLSQWSLDSFPEAFRVGMRGRAGAVGDVGPHAPEHWEGGLGGPDIHAMGWIRTDSDEGREEATRIIRDVREMARVLNKIPEDSRIWKKGGEKPMSAYEYYDHDKLNVAGTK